MLTVAILAAGKGTRMASSLPKVLHKLSGKTLIQRVIDSCNELNPDKIFIIVGHKSEEVKDSVIKNNKIHFIVQNPQKGTGHAVQVLSNQVKNNRFYNSYSSSLEGSIIEYMNEIYSKNILNKNDKLFLVIQDLD